MNDNETIIKASLKEFLYYYNFPNKLINILASNINNYSYRYYLLDDSFNMNNKKGRIRDERFIVTCSIFNEMMFNVRIIFNLLLNIGIKSAFFFYNDYPIFLTNIKNKNINKLIDTFNNIKCKGDNKINEKLRQIKEHSKYVSGNKSLVIYTVNEIDKEAIKLIKGLLANNFTIIIKLFNVTVTQDLEEIKDKVNIIYTYYLEKKLSNIRFYNNHHQFLREFGVEHK